MQKDSLILDLGVQLTQMTETLGSLEDSGRELDENIISLQEHLSRISSSIRSSTSSPANNKSSFKVIMKSNEP